MLLGRVCLSPATGQGYVVVTDALPIQAADADTYSLTLSAESWARIHRYVAARADSVELIGLTHGHNFPPGGDEGDCESCPKRFTCGRHSAFVSDDDRRFLQAVFPLQRNPCQLAHVWGLDPMHASHDALFLVEDGGLRQSPYAVIEMLPDDFMNP